MKPFYSACIGRILQITFAKLTQSWTNKVHTCQIGIKNTKIRSIFFRSCQNILSSSSWWTFWGNNWKTIPLNNFIFHQGWLLNVLQVFYNSKKEAIQIRTVFLYNWLIYSGKQNCFWRTETSTFLKLFYVHFRLTKLKTTTFNS